MSRALPTLFALLLLQGSVLGCVTADPMLYEWGSYEDKLHSAYQNPEDIPAFSAELIRILETSEANAKRPAPGLYAEYGYSLYLGGDLTRAITFFEAERKAWPESGFLMTRIIQRLNERIGERSDDSASAVPDQNLEVPVSDTSPADAIEAPSPIPAREAGSEVAP